ncbi:glycoside hydrolase family 15 protein [Morchella conica CCBAS932]|uniref:glucan 1,4-alpha-glucosidase n=2 Tax=Morchella sect. Distantes TaxID=1051054 RepID=A0A3N4KCX7_9PEZI|nr:glycoside hydrolase family 15 protein [Morchella conica CCBAS932]
MRFTIYQAIGLLSLVSVSLSRSLPEKRQTSVAAWVSTEQNIALSSLFRNIGSSGEFAKSADPGAVIASPSTSSPDYYYQWTRDSAMVFKVLLNQYINGNSSLETMLKEYATESAKLQKTSNPSGSYTTGGIGEPKFYVNGAAFTGGWGRPQLDGPAIRATVLTKFANMLLDAGETSYVTSTLYDSAFPTNSVIKADLEYVANYWTNSGFDLWEEVNGQHFFTYIVQYRALVEGAELANRLGDTGAGTYYTTQAAAIKAKLPSFWSSSKGYLLATLNTGRTGLDCGTLLGSLHGNGARGFNVYPASSPEVLATVKALVDSMKTLYAINTASGAPGVAIGRYPEDVYDGVGTSTANPWFICTLTTAEVLFTAAKEFTAAGSITVTSVNQAFLQQFKSSASSGTTYAAGSTDFTSIIAAINTYADTFVATAQLHAASNGSLSEQFSRTDGSQKGARDLTWSYASFLTTAAARAGTIAF